MYSIGNEKLRTEVYRWETTRNVKKGARRTGRIKQKGRTGDGDGSLRTGSEIDCGAGENERGRIC